MSAMARTEQTSWPRAEQLLAAVVAFAAVMLVLAGASYAIAQAGLFLWFGDWLSPVDAIALLQPAVREFAWIADPQRWLGVHVIVTSAWFGPIAIGGGLALAGVAKAFAAASEE